MLWLNFIFDTVFDLERFPLGWNHTSDKNSLQINMLEHVLFANPRTLLRNML